MALRLTKYAQDPDAGDKWETREATPGLQLRPHPGVVWPRDLHLPHWPWPQKLLLPLGTTDSPEPLPLALLDPDSETYGLRGHPGHPGVSGLSSSFGGQEVTRLSGFCICNYTNTQKEPGRQVVAKGHHWASSLYHMCPHVCHLCFHLHQFLG